jgi:hypothetical protein
MPAEKARLFCATLYSSADIYDQARTALEQEFGAVDHESAALPFTHTRYYEKEMGSNLMRRFISFAASVEPDRLAAAKQFTCRLERQLAQELPARNINLDPGLVTLHNVQLASTKNFAHRLYLGEGIYGEVSLIYENGSYRPLPWTYPDYREAETLAFLQEIRQTLIEKSHKMVDRY